MTDPLINPTYPQVVSALNLLMLLGGIYVMWLLSHVVDRDRVMSAMPMLGLLFITLIVITQLSALRVLIGPDNAIGVETSDRIFRITFIALRVFVIGGLGHVIWVLRGPRKE